MAQNSSRNVVQQSCPPDPTRAENRLVQCGKRNTSPWMSFHPLSSSPISSSSTSMYRVKSFFSTRMRMMVRKAVRRSTSTNELMMLSQWISKLPGKKRLSW